MHLHICVCIYAYVNLHCKNFFRVYVIAFIAVHVRKNVCLFTVLHNCIHGCMYVCLCVCVRVTNTQTHA